jgi:hypothetical protein
MIHKKQHQAGERQPRARDVFGAVQVLEQLLIHRGAYSTDTPESL